MMLCICCQAKRNIPSKSIFGISFKLNRAVVIVEMFFLEVISLSTVNKSSQEVNLPHNNFLGKLIKRVDKV